MAREAFRNKDLQKAGLAHTKEKINEPLHREGHLTGFSLGEVILGGQDGLVNVLGVILGIAAASADVRLVVAGGLAATFAESISMTAVAYTSTLSQADHYQSEVEREQWEMEHFPEAEKEEVKQIYKVRGFEGQLLEDIVKKITSDKKVWLEVMMEEELHLGKVNKLRALRTSFIVGVSAVIGSLVPLSPFFFLPLRPGIIVSIFIAALTLFIVGMYKAKVTIGSPVRSGVEMAVIGTVSALVGYLVGMVFKVK